jgi:hypothetical protein
LPVDVVEHVAVGVVEFAVSIDVRRFSHESVLARQITRPDFVVDFVPLVDVAIVSL